MINELEKIDMLRARLGIGYKEAREALEKAEGDIIQALIDLEEKNRKLKEKIHDRSSEIMEQFKGFYEKGKGVSLKIKQGDETVLDVPAALGAVGALGVLASSELALLAALGSAWLMSRRYSLELDWPGRRKTPETAKVKPLK